MKGRSLGVGGYIQAMYITYLNVGRWYRTNKLRIKLFTFWARNPTLVLRAHPWPDFSKLLYCTLYTHVYIRSNIFIASFFIRTGIKTHWQPGGINVTCSSVRGCVQYRYTLPLYDAYKMFHYLTTLLGTQTINILQKTSRGILGATEQIVQ